MADIKICEIDNKMFRSRTPGSVLINDAVYYDERGRPVRFSGDLCPECGDKIHSNTADGAILPPPTTAQDIEG